MLYLIKITVAMFLLLSMQSAAANPTKIRILSWWDYTHPDVIKDLEKEGYQVEVITYRSNEMAISRLAHNREKFDLAIISQSVIPTILPSTGPQNIFKDIARKRKYLNWISAQARICLPYLWGATVFTYDSRSFKTTPGSLQDLSSSVQKGYPIGVIDDPAEFSARFAIDYGNPLEKANNNNVNGLGFQPSHFVSSVDSILQKPNIITYGWQGASAPAITKNPWLKISAGNNRVVVGYDSVCVVNTDSSKLKDLRKVSKILTNPQNTRRNVKSFQYFSPYQSDTKGLQPPFKELYDKLEKRFLKEQPMFLMKKNQKDTEALNRNWRILRYGK